MPFELMDSRGVLYEDIPFPERQVGFWESKAQSDRQGMDVLLRIPASKSVVSSPLEKSSAIGAEDMELPANHLARNLKGVGGEATNASWNSLDRPLKSWSNMSLPPESYSLDGRRVDINGTQYESSLFSCSLSEIFSRKMRLSGNVLYPPPANAVASCYDKEEPIESLQEIEAKTIGNLLPDEEDLFSGMVDDQGYSTNANGSDDLEDFDLFSSGGGMELEGNDRLSAMQKKSDFVGGVYNGQGVSNGSIVGEHPYGEHPSRTLFVRNINSNVEDSELKCIFEHYGDIRTLYTACKHRGFVMISYYDLRAARNAMRALQNKPLRRRKLDIHYSIPKDNASEKDVNQGTLVVFNVDSSVTNEDLRQIFGIYGEIKEVRESPHKHHHKLIEFYDIRAAETALRVLNRIDISGKQIKLEPSQPGGSKCLVQLSVHEQDEPNHSLRPGDNLSSGCMVMVSPGVITSGGLDGGSPQSLNSAIRSPISAFIANAFPHQSSSIQNTLSSPVRMSSLNTKFEFREPNHSLNEVKFQSQYIPSFHPHSLPEYHGNLANGIPYNVSNIADMAGCAGVQVMEGIEGRQTQKVGLNGHAMEPNGGVFGSSGNGNCPPHGHHYVMSNSNSYQHHPSSPVMWSNSPSFANGVHAHRLRQMSGFPRAPPHILNTASTVRHHVGSAPAVNPSLWDRGHTFSGESPEASNFHLGSLGSVGFAGGSPLHPMEITSRNIYSQVGGNCLDMTPKTGMSLPQQMCHIFPGGNPMVSSMQASYDYPNERARSLSHRRNEANSNHADKKQYELDVDRIMCGEDTRTTLMIKNIPNKYTSKMLLAAIDEHCRGSYDFIYLPIDFKNKCNVGYAFINMVDPKRIIPFYQAFNGKKWEKFNSEKVACLAYGRIQGKAALIAHFQNSSLMNEDKRCRPILFHTAGPNAGDQEPFPMGSNIRSRPGKPRSSGNEDSHLFTFADGEESCNGTDSSSGSIKNSD